MIRRTREADAARRAGARGVTPETLVELASALGTIGARHGVSEDARFAFVSDAMFEVAVSFDRVLGGSVHESILTLLEDHRAALSVEPPPADRLVAEVEVRFQKGKKAELNVLASHLDAEKQLRLVVEVALGVRSVEELRARVDVEERFARRSADRGGVTALRFKRAGRGGARWGAVPLRGSPYGDFDDSVAGVLRCILAVAGDRRA